MPARELLIRAQVSRPTLMRAVRSAGSQVISRGQARRTAYAARRSIRGAAVSLPPFRIDRDGRGTQIANVDATYPQGCAIEFLLPFDWPLPGDMGDGWFDGLPYPLGDMRPQGFLGRNFARHHASLLQVAQDPKDWSEDDVLHALSILGADPRAAVRHAAHALCPCARCRSTATDICAATADASGTGYLA